jgi:hypothetical protein
MGMLQTIASISAIVACVIVAAKAVLDQLAGKYPQLKKIDDVVDAVAAVDAKVDQMIQDAAKPKA